jgi:hypothetical protein
MDTDEPDTDPDIVWSKSTWSDTAESPNPPPMPPPPPAPGLPTPTPTSTPTPTPNPRRDTTRLILILAATAAILLCACIGIATAATFVGREVYDNVKQRNRDAVGLNELVRDGDFEFRVHEITYGTAELADQSVTRQASGQFCLVELTVRNVGDRPATFSDRYQRAFRADGEEYAVDSAAGVLANSDQQIFLNSINPGNTVTGVLVYDIPPDATITRLELRATPSGTGALVTTD